MHLKEKLVKEFNEGLPFHRWLGIEVVGVEIGSVETVSYTHLTLPTICSV